MSVLLAEATVRVKTDVSGVATSAAEQLKRDGSKFSGSGRLAGGLIGASLVAGAGELISHIFDAGFKEYSEASAVNAQLKAGIKSTGDSANVTVDGMGKLAESVAAYSGQATNSISKTESLLLRFTNIRNVGPNKIFDQATVAAANMAARLGGDATQNATKLGRALNDPVHGLTLLTRAGVLFTQGQKDQIKTMVASGDTVGAQKVILAQLAVQFGGAAKAAGSTLPGELGKMKQGFNDVAAALFKLMLPALNALLPAIVSMTKFVKENISWIGPLVGIFTAAAAVIGIVVIAQWAWNVALTANPIGIIIVAIGALIAGLIYFFTQTKLGKEVWKNVMSFLGSAIKVAGDVIGNVVKFIGTIFNWLWINVIKPVVNNITSYLHLLAFGLGWLWANVAQPILTAIGDAFAWLYKNVIKPVIDNIVATLKVFGSGVSWVWKNVISPFVDFVTSGVRTIDTVVGQVFGAIGSTIMGAFNGVAGFIKGVINSVIQTINGALDGINGLIRAVNQVPGVHFPAFDKIPMLARGTNDSPDTFIAGENGPELVTGRPHSTVYDAQKTAGMLGGRGGTHYNFAPGSIILDPKSVKSFTDVVQMIADVTQTARGGKAA